MKGGDGVCPCWLTQASDGIFYGKASTGGRSGVGTVFALDAGLTKPAPQALFFTPQSGAVGQPVRIWGYNLLSAAVRFNGAAATEVSSAGSNYVWATVPAGATSGPITVATPGGVTRTAASFTLEPKGRTQRLSKWFRQRCFGRSRSHYGRAGIKKLRVLAFPGTTVLLSDNRNLPTVAMGGNSLSRPREAT